MVGWIGLGVGLVIGFWYLDCENIKGPFISNSQNHKDHICNLPKVRG